MYSIFIIILYLYLLIFLDERVMLDRNGFIVFQNALLAVSIFISRLL